MNERISHIVRVKFKWPGKILEFTNPLNLPLKSGDKVVVETYQQGSMVGTVAVAPRIRHYSSEDDHLSPVLRLASDQDLALESVSSEFRLDVKQFFETRLKAHSVSGVRLIDCEKADGGRKLIVYYSSENKRFEARAMSIELGQKFGVRIDMRSVGIRDAARLAGGIGKCGLSMCCSTWITEFKPLSIKMAKDQGLSLDPEGLNGQCGRLLCCLGYEHENYVEMGKGLPKVGKVVTTPKGDARVMKLDILKNQVLVKTEEGAFETFTGTEVKRKFGPGNNAAAGEQDEEEDVQDNPHES